MGVRTVSTSRRLSDDRSTGSRSPARQVRARSCALPRDLGGAIFGAVADDDLGGCPEFGHRILDAFDAVCDALSSPSVGTATLTSGVRSLSASRRRSGGSESGGFLLYEGAVVETINSGVASASVVPWLFLSRPSPFPLSSTGGATGVANPLTNWTAPRRRRTIVWATNTTNSPLEASSP